MLLFLTLSGIFLSVLLLYFNARKYTSTIYLGLFFFVLSLYEFVQYVNLYSKSEILVSFFYLNTAFITYMLGPLLYWYMRSLFSDEARLKKNDFWHFIPAIVFLGFSLPYILTPYEFKQEIARAIVANSGTIGLFRSTLIHQVVPIELVYLSRPVLLMIYMVASLFMFIKFLRRKKSTAVLSHQYFMTKWISVFFCFLFLLVLSHTTGILISFKNDDKSIFYTLNFIQIVSAIGLTGLLCSPFFFPGILYGLPRLPEKMQMLKEAPLLNEEEIDAIKKNGFNLESGYLKSIGERIEHTMLKHQPYLQPEFNLTQLSVLLHLPVHHISYYFREEKMQSFNDYRNEWRIKHSKKLIAEGKADELTLEAIGILSGFSTRNTFFNAFKRSEGISPGAYVEQLAQKNQVRI